MNIDDPPVLVKHSSQPLLRVVPGHLAHKQLRPQLALPVQRVAPLAPARPAPPLREGSPPLLGVQAARAPPAVPRAPALALCAAGDVVGVGAGVAPVGLAVTITITVAVAVVVMVVTAAAAVVTVVVIVVGGLWWWGKLLLLLGGGW